MATVKVKFRASSVEGKEGTLYYHLIHQRSLRWISTDITSSISVVCAGLVPTIMSFQRSGTTRSRLSLFLTATTDRHIYS